MTKRTYTFGNSLHEATRKLLLDTPIPVMRISKELKISYVWMMKFRNGEIQDPGANRVQSLWEYLSGRDLEV